MNIAFLGTRGVPSNYGGFETCVQELGQRLVRRGHEITVYCRKSYYNELLSKYLGMNLVYLPNINRKSLDTISHTVWSMLHALTQPFDVMMFFNVANSPCLVIPRLLGKNVVINTDGLEWKRGKWGKIGKLYFKISEFLAAKLASQIVSDSRGIQKYYLEKYAANSKYIAYGAYISGSCKPDILSSLGVKPSDYFLQITRFEPENNALLTIQAYKKLKTEKKLVIVGGVAYQSEYSRSILEEANERIILPGFIYNADILNELWCNCYAYIHGNEVGGTNPALLQTMASGCFCIAIGVAFNSDVLRDCGIYYKKDPDDLAMKMMWTLQNSEQLANYKFKAQQRIKEKYSWEKVTDGYEKLFKELVEGRYK